MDVISYLSTTVPFFWKIVQSLVVLAGAYFVNKLVLQRILNRFAKRADLERHHINPFKKLVSAIVYVAALFVVLSVFGVQGSITSLLAGAGIIGIVVGMATKDVLSDVISGTLLYLQRPFKIGDRVKIGDTAGTVDDIDIMRTEMVNFDNENVSIPNSKVANDTIINMTETPRNRLTVGVDVDYDTDLERALSLCETVLDEEKRVLKDPAPQILVNEFGDSSINLELRFWIDWNELGGEKISPPVLKSEIRNRILDRFREEDIEIPFPHLEIVKKG